MGKHDVVRVCEGETAGALDEDTPYKRTGIEEWPHSGPLAVP